MPETLPTLGPIHTDLNPVIFQKSGDFLIGEPTIQGGSLPYRLETETRHQCAGEPSGQYLMTRPVWNVTQTSSTLLFKRPMVEGL